MIPLGSFEDYCEWARHSNCPNCNGLLIWQFDGLLCTHCNKRLDDHYLADEYCACLREAELRALDLRLEIARDK